MLPDTFASDLASLSVAAHLGVGNPTGEVCFGGGEVDLQDLSASQVHRRDGVEFRSVGDVDLDPHLAEDVDGGVLHGAHERVVASVVVEEEPGAAADRVEGLIEDQDGAAGLLAARSSAFAADAPFTAGPVFTGAFAPALGAAWRKNGFPPAADYPALRWIRVGYSGR